MHIFIDESGTFSLSSKPTSVSAVGALVLPSGRLSYFEKLYRKLRTKLPKADGEVKGRLLAEADIGEVVNIVARCGGFFEVVAIDMALHDEATLSWHKSGQEEAVTRYLGPEHHPTTIEAVWQLRRDLEKMPLQLYVQATALSALSYTVLGHAQTYFAFRTPRELGAFHWVIDAKDKGKLAPYEAWWSTAVLPMLESHSFEEPFPMVVEGDYSHMRRFQTYLSDYKRTHAGDVDDDLVFDLRAVMTEDLRFSDQPNLGLEVVDILVNAIRRSLAGNFSRAGWMPIRRIMIHRNKHALRLISLTKDDLPGATLPYAHVVRDFRNCGISMFPR